MKNLKIPALELPKKDGKLIKMPAKTYIQMSEQFAIDTHLKNLIRTYGLEAVMKYMIEILKLEE